ncbi:hypothetical protein ACIHIX_34195 [Streptomyces sp. NPDC051913]|uniref:hypothetical protein n=1 Tax=Streptomyces sp. NPDC051913 TaxID=3365676 RepID=UPI0037D2C5DC
MSTRLAPTADGIGTFILLMHLTVAGVVPSHRTALPGVHGPRAGLGVVVTP